MLASAFVVLVCRCRITSPRVSCSPRSAVWRCSLHFFLPLVAENAKIHNMEQKLAERDLVSDLQMMGLTELNRRLLSRTEQIEQLMGKRNEEKSDVVVGELKAAREKLDGHYRAFVTYLNAVQELQPEESLSKAAQYYNADLAKIDLQYQQSRKKGGLPDQTGTALSTAE